MKYIIVDPDKKIGNDLKEILDNYEILDFEGNFTNIEVTEHSICNRPPDIAFIKIGEAKLNAFQLASKIRAINPLLKVIFMSNFELYAVEAFEFEAEGFLLIPFEAEKIKRLLRSI